MIPKLKKYIAKVWNRENVKAARYTSIVIAIFFCVPVGLHFLGIDGQWGPHCPLKANQNCFANHDNRK